MAHCVHGETATRLRRGHGLVALGAAYHNGACSGLLSLTMLHAASRRAPPRHSAKRYWRPALAEAKIPDFRFHDLRHTFASRLVAAGVHSLIVQKAGGWSDERMLQRYVHPDPSLIRAAVEKLAPATMPERRDVRAFVGGTPPR